MKIILSFAILLLYQLIGNFIQDLFKLPIPGTVIGMVLLFFSLIITRRRLKHTHTNPFIHFSLKLLRILPILYVPAGVGIMQYFGLIGSQSLPIIGTLVVSAIISLAATAYFMAFVLKQTDKQGQNYD
jgi:holin-like protein